MEAHMAFAGKTRVVKIRGEGKDRKGLVVDVDFITGQWTVLWDDNPEESERSCNPHEFVYEKKSGTKP